MEEWKSSTGLLSILLSELLCELEAHTGKQEIEFLYPQLERQTTWQERSLSWDEKAHSLTNPNVLHPEESGQK